MSSCASYLTFFCPHQQRFIDPRACIHCVQDCKYATPRRRPP